MIPIIYEFWHFRETKLVLSTHRMYKYSGELLNLTDSKLICLQIVQYQLPLIRHTINTDFYQAWLTTVNEHGQMLGSTSIDVRQRYFNAAVTE